MCTYVYVWLCLCVYVSGSKLIISKEFSEPVPGGPVVASAASVPKCHESREISKTRMESKCFEWKVYPRGNYPTWGKGNHFQNAIFGGYVSSLEGNFATLKGVEALRILAGNLPILTSQRHLQIMHFFVPLVRLEENFSSPNWNSQGSLDSDIVISSMITYDNIYIRIFVSTSTNT